jgi:hypothetical chaperone protein
VQSFVGIDFGTTNSAIAVANGAGPARTLAMPANPGTRDQAWWRTILFFERSDRVGELAVSAGARAIARFAETEGDGRLIQSIKSHLASASFKATQILGRRFTLEMLVGAFLTRLRWAAESELGGRAVVGRPVRYWGSRAPEDNDRAIERMRAALALAGFDEVVFEFEPIAAALQYATRLDRDELVLIADFGGGTSDFSLIRVGPGVDPGDASAILATGGVAIGGDNFDARIIDAAVAPRLGKGTEFSDEMGARAPVPPWLYSHLRRWHHLSFLRAPKTSALLERIHTGADEREAIAAFIHVVDNELGLPLHRSVENAKVALSADDRAALTFHDDPVRIDADLARDGFESWIDPELESIDATVTEVLDQAGGATDIDRVFATGGSSLVPVVRAMLAARFGADRVVGGEELTSVAGGLAIRARQVFG